jgi:ketosteroid isomerase-like protein
MLNGFGKCIGAALFSVSMAAIAACSPQSQQPQGSASERGILAQQTQTEEVMRRFNQVFADHDPAALPELIAQDVVMESMQHAPNGTRYEGYDVNLAFWQALAADRSTSFENEEMTAIGDRAIVRWRLHFGEGQTIRGVTLLRVRDGRIVEALAYSKVPGEPAPLPSQH